MFKTLRKILPENSFLRRWYSAANGFLAAVFYGFPARSLTCIGITGTDGKTTTTEMVAHVLRANGKKVISFSTVSTRCGDTELQTDKRTTPSPWTLQKILKKAKNEEMEYAVIEVSSHALVQKRVFGISFTAAVLTNITPEHLDYHGSFEEYAKAKKLLFTKKLKRNGVAVLNIGDDSGAKWSKEFSQKEKAVLLYSAESKGEALSPYNLRFTSSGMDFGLRAEDSQTGETSLPIFGEFNIQNAMAAVQVARFFGISFEEATKSLPSFSGVKGRMEPISAEQDFFALVDFAITPGAVENLLQAARKMATEKRLLLIFGSCGTHPDIDIRKAMGEVAAKHADVVIITDDEPYHEDPAQIRSHILSGARAVESNAKTADIHEIADRKQAMEFACANAQKGDVVLVSGMGHLNSRNIAGKEVEWNDGEILKEILST